MQLQCHRAASLALGIALLVSCERLAGARGGVAGVLAEGWLQEG